MNTGEYQIKIIQPHPDGDGYALILEQLIGYYRVRTLTTDGWKEREFNTTLSVDYVKLSEKEVLEMVLSLIRSITGILGDRANSS